MRQIERLAQSLRERFGGERSLPSSDPRGLGGRGLGRRCVVVIVGCRATRGVDFGRSPATGAIGRTNHEGFQMQAFRVLHTVAQLQFRELRVKYRAHDHGRELRLFEQFLAGLCRGQTEVHFKPFWRVSVFQRAMFGARDGFAIVPDNRQNIVTGREPLFDQRARERPARLRSWCNHRPDNRMTFACRNRSEP